MVVLLDARGRLHDPNAMDVGHCWSGPGLEHEIIAIDVEAWVTMQTTAAFRREKGREGKTKDMAERLGGQAAKNGTEGKGPVGKGTDKGTVTCSHCGKRGHDLSRCRTLHPEQLSWKGANGLGYDYDVAEDTRLDIRSVEAGKWVAPSKSPCATESEGEDDDTCTGDYFDVGGLDNFMPDVGLSWTREGDS